MRTPGADLELATGFVLSEGIITDIEAIAGVRHCGDAALEPDERGNVVTVDLRASVDAPVLLERHVAISSACGVCGSAGIALLRSRGYPRLPPGATIGAALLGTLPETMRLRERVFEATGDLHAPALFALDGTLLVLREDIGRHNAVDKVVGWLAMQRTVEPQASALAVSGSANPASLKTWLASLCSASIKLGDQ